MSEENKVEEIAQTDDAAQVEIDNSQENIQKLAGEILRLRDELAMKDDAIMRERAENQNLRNRHARELDDKGKHQNITKINIV